MKEQYLHNKLREQGQKIEILIETLQKLVSKPLINFEELKKEIFKQIEKNHYELKFSDDERITQLWKERHQDAWKEIYEKLHSQIATEMKAQRKGNKEWILKFIDEVILQRKDYSNIISLLLEKKIFTLQEMCLTDKQMIKEIDKSNVTQQIWGIFYPRIGTSK